MISIFFALLKAAKVAEQMEQNAIIQPNRAVWEGMKYKPTMERIGNRDEPTIARTRTTLLILPSEYRIICPFSLVGSDD